jgi:hypothetical protein
MSTSEENLAKLRLLGAAMNGGNDQVVQALLNTLPATTQLDEEGMKRLSLARQYMSELWMRGVSKNAFLNQTGLTGAPVEPDLEFAKKQQVRGEQPIYFNLWLAEKDPIKSADAVKALLLARQQGIPEEYRSSFRLVFFVDIDTAEKEFPIPYEAGLTPHAVCFDLPMGDVQNAFPAVESVCEQLAPFAQQKLRFGLGQFALQEYDGIRRGSLYTKGMPFNMGSEWILLKNIQRRAGKFGWFWQLVARVRDKHDNGQ